MRILLVNELLEKGGTEIQTKREFDYFTMKGHEVFLLTFDPSANDSFEDNRINIKCDFNLYERIYHRLWCSKSATNQIKKLLQTINPDVIHINNVWRLSLDVMRAVSDYPTVQTIRDYGAICPKLTCIYSDGSICGGYKHSHCKQCVYSSFELRLKYISMCRYNRIRLRSISTFLAPSKALADACTMNGIKTACLNNPFDSSRITVSPKTKHSRKILLYYGLISEMKGIDQFVHALDTLQQDDYEMWFAGDIEANYRGQFNKILSEHSGFKYLGKLQYQAVMDLYKDVYCVVAPSLWIENYPNTVLEAIANKTLAIGSNRGGIPELIGNDCFLFDVTNIKDIAGTAKYALSISEEEYKSHTEERYQYIRNNNSLESYYTALISLYGKLISEE